MSKEIVNPSLKDNRSEMYKEVGHYFGSGRRVVGSLRMLEV